MTAGVTSVAGVQRTTIPDDPNFDVTEAGAFGNEYVFACAEGTNIDRSKDAARAREPKPRDLFLRDFMAQCKYLIATTSSRLG